MDTSEYNATLQPGEKPVGSGAKAMESKVPGTTRFSSLGEFHEAQRTRHSARVDSMLNDNGEKALETARAARQHAEQTKTAWDSMVADMAEDNFKATPLGRAQAAEEKSNRRVAEVEAKLFELEAEREAEAAANTKLAADAEKALTGDVKKQPQEAKPENQPKPNYEIDPALADPWDLTPEQRAAAQPEDEGFEKYRNQKYRGHTITPDSMLSNTRVDVTEIQAAANDVGIAARRDGIGQEGAQVAFDLIGQNYQPPQGETFDFDTGRQQVYGACGEKTEEVLADLQSWVAKRPAVAAFLEDGVMLGNHGPTLLTLAGVALAAKAGLDLTRPGDARVYIERMVNDQSSPYWNHGPLHKVTVMAVQYAMGVADLADRKSKR